MLKVTIHPEMFLVNNGLDTVKRSLPYGGNAQAVNHYSFLQRGETVTGMSYCRETDVLHVKLMK